MRKMNQIDANTVKFYHSQVIKRSFSLIMEYCEGGSLAEEIRGKIETGTYYSEDELLATFTHLCGILHNLHSHNVFHRDIKPDNIFIDANHIYKFGDFGESKLICQSINTIRGTQYYMSPSLLKTFTENLGKGNKHRVDLGKEDTWSLGKVFLEMAGRTTAQDFSKSSIGEIREKAMKILEKRGVAVRIIDVISLMLRNTNDTLYIIEDFYGYFKCLKERKAFCTKEDVYLLPSSEEDEIEENQIEFERLLKEEKQGARIQIDGREQSERKEEEVKTDPEQFPERKEKQGARVKIDGREQSERQEEEVKTESQQLPERNESRTVVFHECLLGDRDRIEYNKIADINKRGEEGKMEPQQLLEENPNRPLGFKEQGNRIEYREIAYIEKQEEEYKKETVPSPVKNVIEASVAATRLLQAKEQNNRIGYDETDSSRGPNGKFKESAGKVFVSTDEIRAGASKNIVQIISPRGERPFCFPMTSAGRGPEILPGAKIGTDLENKSEKKTGNTLSVKDGGEIVLPHSVDQEKLEEGYKRYFPDKNIYAKTQTNLKSQQSDGFSSQGKQNSVTKLAGNSVIQEIPERKKHSDTIINSSSCGSNIDIGKRCVKCAKLKVEITLRCQHAFHEECLNQIIAIQLAKASNYQHVYCTSCTKAIYFWEKEVRRLPVIKENEQKLFEFYEEFKRNRMSARE